MKKRKSSLSILTVLAMLFSLFAASLPVCAEEAGEGAEALPVYIASEGFSGTQGANGWSYYGLTVATDKPTAMSNYTYNTAQEAWVTAASTTNLFTRGKMWKDAMLPGNNKSSSIGVVREYEVKTKGTVTIDTNNVIQAQNPEATDIFTVQIRIRKNQETIYPADKTWESLTTRDAKSAFKPLTGIQVKSGDKITFEVKRGDVDSTVTATNLTKNILNWDPVIRYTSVVQRSEIYRDNFTTLNTDFWRNKTNDWVAENGRLTNTGTSSNIRFYAPHAVNYSMSFDLEFLSIDTSGTSERGFFTAVRRPNDKSDYYRTRLVLTDTADKNQIIYGVGSGSESKFVTDTSKTWSKGTEKWQTGKVYHITESVETDGDKNNLTFTVTDGAGNEIASISDTFESAYACPAGGGGFSIIGKHQVAISNFVLEGETSDLVVDDDVKFFADAGLQTPVTADTLNGELYAAIKTTSGFSNDFSSKQTPRIIILAAYENGEDGSLRLKKVRVNQAYVTSATDTVSVSFAADEIETGLTYRAFVWEEVGNMKPCAPVKELE